MLGATSKKSAAAQLAHATHAVGIGIPELALQTKAEDQRNNPGHTDVLRQSELGASAGDPA